MAKKCWFYTAGQFRMGGTRIENNLRKFAPDDIVFVDSYEECDFVVAHMQMKYDIDRFLDNKKPLIFLISELDKLDNVEEYYNHFFDNCCVMTYTFHPLELMGFNGKNQNHVWGAWGVDTEIFNIDPDVAVKKKRDNTIITFGFYDSEHYTEIYEAVRLVEGKMIHLDFKIWDFMRQGKYFDPRYHWYREYVSDEELNELYSNTMFVSGLRSGAGFEVPVLEGMLMGCRPLCFDSIYYKKWFSDFALFVPEGEYDIDMTNNVLNYLRNADEHRVKKEEINYVKEKYGWKTIATNFWKEVKRSI